MTALGLGAALAFGAAALSVSWVFIPLLAAAFGMPQLQLEWAAAAGRLAAGVLDGPAAAERALQCCSDGAGLGISQH